mgnify:CR=1 FL=1
MRVNARELSEWLGVTPQAISKSVKENKLQPDADGLFPLKATVQKAFVALRGKKRGQGESKDLDRSLKYWQVEKAKQAVVSWRLQFGKDIAMQIIDRLDSALSAFQKVTSADPNVNAAILALAQSLKEARLEDALYSLDDNDDNDGGDDEG